LKNEANQTEHLIPHGESPFRDDPYLGRQLLPGQDFIGASDFVSFDEAVREIRDSGKKVILNAGDSSTAGWDTRVTVENQQRRKREEPLLSAFFRYPTYSDLLRDDIGNDYIVLNAGIPGHTAINAQRRIHHLLHRFRTAGVKIDFVSLYIGNNDCQWERNIEDKHSLRSSLKTPLFVDRARAKRRKPDYKRIHLRTNQRDFRYLISKILVDCRGHGAVPVVIVPETPLYWEPGKRFVRDNYPVDPNMPGGAMVIAALEKAKEIWQQALQQEWSGGKLRALESAREMDFVIPRIKQSYRAILESVARDSEAPLVRPSVPRESDDGRYFVDYCHPIGETNRAIASEISKIVAKFEAGELTMNLSKPSLLYRFLDSRFMDGVANLITRSGQNTPKQSEENKDIYTLY
jgi:hypothetical protein